jgi:hypothetical protein
VLWSLHLGCDSGLVVGMVGPGWAVPVGGR